jgi:hypothetical protein
MLLLTCVGLLAACSSDSGPYRTLSGDYDKGAPAVKEGSGFEVFYSPPPGRIRRSGLSRSPAAVIYCPS